MSNVVKGENMKTKILVIAFILSLAMNFGFIFSYLMIAHERSQFHHKEDMGRMNNIQRELNLSKEQMAMMHEQGEKIKSANACYRDSMAQFNFIVLDLLNDSTADTAKIDSLLREISRLQAKMQRNAIFQFINNRRILTPTQHKILIRTIRTNIPPCEFAPPAEDFDRENPNK